MEDRIIKPIKEVYKEFFNELKKYLSEDSSELRVKVINKNYMDISLDNNEYHICVSSDSVRKKLDIRVYISDNKELFKELQKKERLINEKLGFKLDWRDPNEKSSYAIITENFDIRNPKDWNSKFKFIADRSQKIYEVFNLEIF